MDLPLALFKLAESQGKRDALIWPGGALTFADLAKKMDALAAGLQGLGLRKGDRVAVQLLNCPEFVIAYFAIMRLGGVIVPINPHYKARELQYLMADSGAGALITAPEFVATIDAIRAELPDFRHLIVAGGEKRAGCVGLDDLYLEDRVPALPELSEKDLATIIYTSGTTGRPKGAMLSTGSVYQNAWLTSRDLQFTPDERTLIVIPLFHIAAQIGCLAATLVQGGTCYIEERWIDAETTLDSIQRHRITFFLGVPTMYLYMLSSPDLNKYDLSSLRICFCGAAPLAIEALGQWKKRTGLEIVEAYGLSETTAGCTRNPPLGVKKPGSIGTAYDHVAVKVFDGDDREVPAGEVGEIVVRGPNVLMGYWNNPEATAAVMRNRWFHTGDLAYADPEGYLFIVDRTKDMINRAGMKIYSREVEEVIYRYPGIMEAAVIGIPDEVMGEEVCAYVSTKPGAKVDTVALREFCKQELIHYKVPRRIFVLPELPKTATGKIQKTELRKAAAAS